MRRLRAAIRVFIETLGGAPYFDLDDPDAMTPEQWAGLIVLHAEAVHGCEHTGDARAALGMVGPRGKVAA